jgi:hypothetical protein
VNRKKINEGLKQERNISRHYYCTKLFPFDSEHLSQSCQKSGQELDEQKSYQTMGIHNWTQTGKGTHIRTLCQKNEGSAEIKQGQIKTAQRTLSSKRTHFQTETDGRSHL